MQKLKNQGRWISLSDALDFVILNFPFFTKNTYFCMVDYCNISPLERINEKILIKTLK